MPATFCYAQGNDTLNVAHIKSYPDHFFLWPVLKQRELNFRIRDLEENRSVRYRPNNSYALGVGAYVFDISFELTFAIPLNERNRDVFGKSTARDFQINALSKKWGADVFVQRYHGFYSDVDLNAGTLATLPSRPDITARNTGLTGLYVFNPDRYSLRSAFNFSERQLISGGSLMLTGTLNTFKADAEGALTQVDEPDSGGALRALRYTTLSLAPGYAYTFVRHNFFASGAVMAGPAHNWIYYQKEDNSTIHDIQFNTFASVRLGIGYSTDLFFAGLNFVQQSRTVKFDNLRFTSNTSTFRLLVGFRFRESGILKKNVADLPAELRKI
ncbi:MAG TPA: DUF4421 family protein [Cyclobacteriaceae bacterium]|nr:DUF4421 family protein [Cyclobacteriaceae bacterium]